MLSAVHWDDAQGLLGFPHAAPSPVDVFLLVFPRKSVAPSRTSPVPGRAAWSAAGSGHRRPSTCPAAGGCWPSPPLPRKEQPGGHQDLGGRTDSRHLSHLKISQIHPSDLQQQEPRNLVRCEQMNSPGGSYADVFS